jgi:hypothetical protein
MADGKITVEELAEFMQRQLPMTYDLFDKNRDEDNHSNTASWARGRIDAFLQIMAIIDKDREAMLRAEWERVVTGQGFMD